jgi:class 3 adenylate cyclase
MAAEFKYEPQFEIMTVLITDIAGFSKVSERVEPNTVIATLSLYMNMLSRIVYQFNGEVDKYLGDGMFAFFRQPSEAVEAARRIQRRVEQFNVQQSARGMMQFPTRIGIATGKVLLALIGSTSRREYTLIGDRVNVAARLQELAPVGGIAIDEVTYQAASTPAYVASDTFVLKGKEKLERVYLLKLES